jgi:hypothetical protein
VRRLENVYDLNIFKEVVMDFNKEAILNCDIGELTQQEREYLIMKYYSGPVPEWKEDLRREWMKLEYERLWCAYTGSYELGDEGIAYRYTHNLLMRLGSMSNPEALGNRVTDYTKWLMSLYLNKPRSTDLRIGKKIERNIARLAKPSTHPDWELVYRDPLNRKPEPLIIRKLTVNGECLWGAPDLVYRNSESGEMLIIERKASNKHIPSDGWPKFKSAVMGVLSD